MCDDQTLAEMNAADMDAATTVTRRRFTGLVGAAAAVAGCSGGTAFAAKGKLTEAMVAITTPDGTCDAFFVHPAKGKAPGVILWPDIGGLRDAFKEMARRLAGHGYAVLAVNHYYRGAKAPVLASFAEWRTPEGQAKITPLTKQVNPATIATDTAAFVAWLDQQKAVNTRRGIGTQGYCMTGPWTVRAAAMAAARIGAAASFHGGGLVTQAPDSPHLLLGQTKARFLFAIAKNDDTRAPTDKDTLKAAATAAQREAEVEVYGGDHGWTVLDSPVYNQGEAARAFQRMLALYAKL